MTAAELVPQCAQCKRVRFNGTWVTLDAEILEDETVRDRTTHGLCPTCDDAYRERHGLPRRRS